MDIINRCGIRESTVGEDMKKNKIGVALLSLGVLFFIVGFYNGEVMVVLNKAIRICLECVGIG